MMVIVMILWLRCSALSWSFDLSLHVCFRSVDADLAREGPGIYLFNYSFDPF